MTPGSELTVLLHAVSETLTRLTIQTGEAYTVGDWGRNARAAYELLDSVNAATY